MWVRDRRKELGLSQHQVAAVLDADPSRVSRMETGLQVPTLYELGPLAQVLKVDVLSILNAFGLYAAPVDFSRLPADLVQALRDLDAHGLDVLAYTARGLLLQQSEEPELE